MVMGKKLSITWTDYPQHTIDLGIQNEWIVEVGEGEETTHLTRHREVEEALLMARIIMNRMRNE